MSLLIGGHKIDLLCNFAFLIESAFVITCTCRKGTFLQYGYMYTCNFVILHVHIHLGTHVRDVVHVMYMYVCKRKLKKLIGEAMKIENSSEHHAYLYDIQVAGRGYLYPIIKQSDVHLYL